MIKIVESNVGFNSKLEILKQFLKSNGYQNAYDEIYEKDGTKDDLSRVMKELEKLGFKADNNIDKGYGSIKYYMYKFPVYRKHNIYVTYSYEKSGKECSQISVGIDEPIWYVNSMYYGTFK